MLFACHMQANSIGHLVCQCCQITLMYAHGAQSVKCAVCNNVTPVGQSPGGQTGQGPSPSPSPRQKRTQMVVIENPPTLDSEGNEVKFALCPDDSLANFFAVIMPSCLLEAFQLENLSRNSLSAEVPDAHP